MPGSAPPPKTTPEDLLKFLDKAMDKMDPSDLGSVAGMASDLKATKAAFDALRADVTVIGGNLSVMNDKLDAVAKKLGIKV